MKEVFEKEEAFKNYEVLEKEEVFTGFGTWSPKGDQSPLRGLF